MNNLFKSFLVVLLFLLVSANIFLFCSSLKISDEINQFEIKISSLHRENIQLEKEVSYLSSLKYAESRAYELDFTKKSQPTYLNKLGVAKRN